MKAMVKFSTLKERFLVGNPSHFIAFFLYIFVYSFLFEKREKIKKGGQECFF